MGDNKRSNTIVFSPLWPIRAVCRWQDHSMSLKTHTSPRVQKQAFLILSTACPPNGFTLKIKQIRSIRDGQILSRGNTNCNLSHFTGAQRTSAAFLWFRSRGISCRHKWRRFFYTFTNKALNRCCNGHNECFCCSENKWFAVKSTLLSRLLLWNSIFILSHYTYFLDVSTMFFWSQLDSEGLPQLATLKTQSLWPKAYTHFLSTSRLHKTSV